MGAKEAVLIVVAIFFVIVILSIFFGNSSSSGNTSFSSSYFSISDVGRAGSFAYVNANYSGSIDVAILSYDSRPKDDIFILDEQGIGNENIEDFVKKLGQLREYNYTPVTITEFSEFREGTYILPTGAMPYYFLQGIKDRANTTIIYFGKSDLIIKDGVKRADWYSELNESEKSKFIIYDVMPDDAIIDSEVIASIAESNWSLRSKDSMHLSGSGTTTLVSNVSNSSFVRIVISNGTSYVVSDYPGFMNNSQISIGYASVLPSEPSSFYFSIPKSNGTLEFVVEKDGKEIKREKLRRVTEEQLFRQDLVENDSGMYVLKLIDNSGVIGGGILHISDISINLENSFGSNYLFNVTLDGKPIKSEKILVSLNGGTTENSYVINDGLVMIPAQLKKGENTLNFGIFGHSYPVKVLNNRETIVDIYIRYGIPGVIIVFLVFIFARFSKRPAYTIRIGNVPNEIRKEVRVSVDDALGIFRKVEYYIGVSGPITSREFALALKKSFTEGADVTEGNIEEILQKLEKTGYIENHKNYYQLKSKGNVKHNYILRIIREKLIANGIRFEVSGNIIRTKDFDVGFPDSTFARKGVIVFEDEQELQLFKSSLSQRKIAELRIKQANGIIELATLNSLDEML